MKKIISLVIFFRQYTKYILNLYGLTVLATVLWMLFFDRYDLFSQHDMSNNIKQLELDKAFYQGEISKVKAEYDILLNDPKRIERFARENYWMKRSNEDIYIFVEEK